MTLGQCELSFEVHFIAFGYYLDIYKVLAAAQGPRHCLPVRVLTIFGGCEFEEESFCSAAFYSAHALQSHTRPATSAELVL